MDENIKKTEEMQLTIDQEIALVIDSQYSIDAQIALLRQKDTKPQEWAEFNAFCEEVKKKIKESRKEE